MSWGILKEVVHLLSLLYLHTRLSFAAVLGGLGEGIKKCA